MVKSTRKRISNIITLCGGVFLLASCSLQKAQKSLLNNPALSGAHVGIAIYNDTKSTWVTKYQSEHYFTPASNTKILATYTALQYLGDSLPGWKMASTKDTLYLYPQGDPSFMHADFTYQPVVDLIKSSTKPIVIATHQSKDKFGVFGDGWAWNDRGEEYQVERSRMPFLGNQYTYQHLSLQDTLKVHFQEGNFPSQLSSSIIKTVPTDALLKIMMSRSDNFYAEQVLLMASEQVLGKMDDAAIIDTIMKTDFAQLPQPMKWADGSGLSRYNLNTPENYVAILKQMQHKFGEERVKNIFEKGGEGTLSNYYKQFPGTLYAKTGTLGGQVALSGFMYTSKNQKLYFSVLVSNHLSKTSGAVRRAVEEYLQRIASKL